MTQGRGSVLVVDDDPVNRLFLEIMLDMEGYRILTAADGLEALAVLAREPVDLILMDIVMPRMGGMEAVGAIRRGGYAASAVPIVAVTASEVPGCDRTFLEAGMDGFVPKPVDGVRLLGLMHKLMA